MMETRRATWMGGLVLVLTISLTGVAVGQSLGQAAELEIPDFVPALDPCGATPEHFVEPFVLRELTAGGLNADTKIVIELETTPNLGTFVMFQQSFSSNGVSVARSNNDHYRIEYALSGLADDEIDEIVFPEGWMRIRVGVMQLEVPVYLHISLENAPVATGEPVTWHVADLINNCGTLVAQDDGGRHATDIPVAGKEHVGDNLLLQFRMSSPMQVGNGLEYVVKLSDGARWTSVGEVYIRDNYLGDADGIAGNAAGPDGLLGTDDDTNDDPRVLDSHFLVEIHHETLRLVFQPGSPTSIGATDEVVIPHPVIKVPCGVERVDLALTTNIIEGYPTNFAPSLTKEAHYEGYLQIIHTGPVVAVEVPEDPPVIVPCEAPGPMGVGPVVLRELLPHAITNQTLVELTLEADFEDGTVLRFPTEIVTLEGHELSLQAIDHRQALYAVASLVDPLQAETLTLPAGWATIEPVPGQPDADVNVQVVLGGDFLDAPCNPGWVGVVARMMSDCVPTQTPTDTATETPTETPTPTSTDTPADTATPTQTPALEPTATETPGAAETETPTATPTDTSVEAPTQTPTMGLAFGSPTPEDKPEDTPPTGHPGDINGDGRVDALDLFILAAMYGERRHQVESSSVQHNADLNQDGAVDLEDVRKFVISWSRR